MSSTSPTKMGRIDTSKQKPVQSCQFCRRRKIRCDKSTPSCMPCLKANTECIYPMRKGRSWKSSSTSSPVQSQSKEQLLRRIRKLESAIESLGVEGSRLDSADTDVIDSLGKLTIEKPYLNNGFWGSNELNDLLKESTDEIDSEDEQIPKAATTSKGVDFVFGVSPVFEDLSFFHPPISQVLHYWQVYLDNCECLLKLVHTPTMNRTIQNAVRNDFHDLDKSDELLMFSFYFAAITSLSEDEVQHQLGQEKSTLMDRYELAIKHGLTRARFLKTQDLKVLQALVLYLTCIPNIDSTVAAVVWNMIGLTFRIAQSMAVDRDGELFKLKPFETELRRRLWYHLLYVDFRAAEGKGCLSTMLQYDTRFPTNLNDSDIYPEMTEYPKPVTGLTEMTVPLLRYESARLGRRLQATGFRDTVLSPPVKKKLIQKVQQDLKDKYIKYCQGAGPLYEYAAKAVMMVTSRTNLIIYQDTIKNASQAERDWLFLVCIQIMEFYAELRNNFVARKWSWLIKIHVQWHAVAFALKELCDRPPGSSPDMIDRAWAVIDATSDEWKPPSDSAGTVVYDSVKKLLAKARRRRERYNQSSDENSMSPPRSVRPNVDSKRPSQGGSSVSPNLPLQQQQMPFETHVPYEYQYGYTNANFYNPTDLNVGIGIRPGLGISGSESFVHGYGVQMSSGREEFTSLPEWFFPSMNQPPMVVGQEFDMGIYNTDDVIN